jgi:hypothetical protein
VRYENVVSSSGEIRVALRLRNPRGCFIQWGSSASPLAVLGQANISYGSPETSFVCPVPLRLLDWGWNAQSMDNNDTIELRRNGGVIAEAEDLVDFGGSGYRHGVTQLGGVPVAAGDVLTVTLNGFSSSTTCLIRATAEPLALS